MATPNTNSHAMKHALSQQGRTPSQSQGAAATPPVSTPFSAAHAAFSPHGPRSSPQQVKKSPATTGTLAANSQSNAALNFDSPSTVAAFNALQIGGGLDLGLQGLNALGKNENEFAKKLDDVLEKLKRVKGLVSEQGLERLAKGHGFEVFWEGTVGASSKKTLFIGGSALELSIAFSSPHIVESATLLYPESSDIVKKYAEGASKILTENLQLAPQQSFLTKEMDDFARNFESIANLEKLGDGQNLNLHEAVVGIYESLVRLHDWETNSARKDPTFAGKDDTWLEKQVMCSKSGVPAMNRRDAVGLTIDYWIDNHLKPMLQSPSPTKEQRGTVKGTIRAIRIGCAPLPMTSMVGPVRISEKWIGEEVEKVPLPGELTNGPVINWLEPDSTFIVNDQTKAGDQAPYSGPRLPQVAFQAIFEPPVPIPLSIWELIEGQGCGLPPLPPTTTLSSYDALIFPLRPTPGYDPMEARQISCLKTIITPAPGPVAGSPRKAGILRVTHENVLLVYKPIYGRVLSDVAFSHPQQIISILPYIRQYTLLRKLLETSFKEDKEDAKPSVVKSSTTDDSKGKKIIKKSNFDDFSDFMETKDVAKPKPPRIDVTLMVHPMPRLQLVFPLKDRTADIVLEIRPNGVIHIVSQNVLGSDNAASANTNIKTPEGLARKLEVCENLNTFCEFIRSHF
ncbi:hypothetical protein OQA88_13612 [Cercophora sp. LCS_1]